MKRATIWLVLLTVLALPAMAQSTDPRCRTAGLQCPRAFSDVPPSHWAERFVGLAVARGYMTDCGGLSFCPDATVSRGDMAVVIENAKHNGAAEFLGAPTGLVFRDVPVNEVRACWIEQLYADGVVGGCRFEDPFRYYCPNDLVNRAQMAVFLCAAAGIPPVNPPTGYFTDVHGTAYQWAEGFIEAIFNAGITAGCDVHMFCPGDTITRAQLAVWTGVAFPPPSGVDTIGVYRSSDQKWFLRNSNSAGTTDLEFSYGSTSSDVPVVGDWNGDGTDTVGVYRNNTFYLRNSNAAGSAEITVAFGQTGDIPVAGDWDGDSVDTIGVYRPSNRTWYLRNSNTAGGAEITFVFGAVTSSVPVAGDWDGDGVDTVGYYRNSNSTFYLRNTNLAVSSYITAAFGVAGDIPITRDWDGNGTDTIGVYRPASATWLLRNSNTPGAADMTFIFGSVNQKPVTGDWNGS